MAQIVKNLPANTGDIRDGGLIPGSGRSPGGECRATVLGITDSNPLQYSCLENPMDKEACQAMVNRVTKSQA